MAGRPKGFDRDSVLANAMEVFWVKGFSGASIKELEVATGVGRQSLYNEFHDKDGLFLAAIEHYDQNVTQKAINILTGDGLPTENIRGWLESLIEVAASDDRRGCMLTNSTMSVDIADETMRTAMKGVTAKLIRAIRSALKRAATQGLIAPETDVPTMTSYLLSTAQGLLVLGRMGNSRASLRRVMALSLQALETNCPA